jgi:hypothetical protein
VNRKHILVAFAVLSLLSAGLVTADDFEECKKELTEQLVKNNPQADKITFEQKTQSNKSRTEMLYEGTGSFVRHTGQKETLTWQCTVDKGTVKDAHYSVKTDTVSPDMVSACHNAIIDRIREENPGTGTVTFRTSTARQSQMEASRKRFEGSGYALITGEDVDFDYQCIFDANGALTDKKYEMK